MKYRILFTQNPFLCIYQINKFPSSTAEWKWCHSTYSRGKRKDTINQWEYKLIFYWRINWFERAKLHTPCANITLYLWEIRLDCHWPLYWKRNFDKIGQLILYWEWNALMLAMRGESWERKLRLPSPSCSTNTNKIILCSAHLISWPNYVCLGMQVHNVKRYTTYFCIFVTGQMISLDVLENQRPDKC